VRRRQRSVSPSGAPVPVRLLQFREDEWPGTTWPAFRAWSDAPKEFEDEHGWPGGEAASFAEWLEVCRSLPDEPWDPDAV
jgi:hypothetical protein